MDVLNSQTRFLLFFCKERVSRRFFFNREIPKKQFHKKHQRKNKPCTRWINWHRIPKPTNIAYLLLLLLQKKKNNNNNKSSPSAPSAKTIPKAAASKQETNYHEKLQKTATINSSAIFGNGQFLGLLAYRRISCVQRTDSISEERRSWWRKRKRWRARDRS